MATSPAVADGSSIPSPAHKMSLGKMILAILVAVLLAIVGVGGGIYYLMKSGRVPMAKGAVIVEKTATPAPTTPVSSHTLSLESVVANLADASGPAYLKMGLSLKIADEPVKKGAKEKEEKAPKGGMTDEEAGVRDTVLMVLGHQTATGLLETDGKERLKEQLKTALAEHNPELKVLEVHFTDFLVQR